MKAKRLLALLLAMLCVFPTACSNAADNETSGSKTNTPDTSNSSDETVVGSNDATVTDDETSDDPRLNAKDNLPADLKFDGDTVTVLHRGGDSNMILEIYAEEDNADVVVSAVYQRNALVEDRLGIEIGTIQTTDTQHQGGGVLDQVRTAVTAGTKDFDLFANHMSQTTPIIIEGALLNLYDNQYIDWEQPWWNQSFTDELEIDGKVYFAVGELSQSMIRGAYVMYYNKDLYAQYYNGQDLYQIVNEGKWTLDLLSEYCASLYNDTNGNQTNDINDFHGMVLTGGTDSGTHDGFTGAAGVELVKKNSDGVPELVINGERTFAFCEAMNKLLWSGNNVYNTTVDAEPPAKFMANNAMFYPTFLSATETLRDMEADYGIIPLPKLNEDQADYSGFTHNGLSVFALPITSNDRVDICGAFLEAMCVESYRSVTPAYYEVALKQKYARDNVVSQMLDQIMSDIRFDFGYVYSASLGDLIKIFRKLNGADGTSPASTLKSTQKVTVKSLERLVENIEALDH